MSAAIYGKVCKILEVTSHVKSFGQSVYQKNSMLSHQVVLPPEDCYNLHGLNDDLIMILITLAPRRTMHPPTYSSPHQPN